MSGDSNRSRREVIRRAGAATVTGLAGVALAGEASADPADAVAHTYKRYITGFDVKIRVYLPSDVSDTNRLDYALKSIRYYLENVAADTDRIDNYTLLGYTTENVPTFNDKELADDYVDAFGHTGGGNIWLGYEGGAVPVPCNHPVSWYYDQSVEPTYFGNRYPHAFKTAPSTPDWEPVQEDWFRWSVAHECHHLLSSGDFPDHGGATVRSEGSRYGPYTTVGNRPGRSGAKTEPCPSDQDANYFSAEISDCAATAIDRSVRKYRNQC